MQFQVLLANGESFRESQAAQTDFKGSFVYSKLNSRAITTQVFLLCRNWTAKSTGHVWRHHNTAACLLRISLVLQEVLEQTCSTFFSYVHPESNKDWISFLIYGYLRTYWFSKSPLSVVSACSTFQLKFSISASNCACWYSNWNWLTIKSST